MARMLRLTLDWMICCCRLSVTVNTTYKGIRNLIDHMPHGYVYYGLIPALSQPAALALNDNEAAEGIE